MPLKKNAIIILVRMGRLSVRVGSALPEEARRKCCCSKPCLSRSYTSVSPIVSFCPLLITTSSGIACAVKAESTGTKMYRGAAGWDSELSCSRPDRRNVALKIVVLLSPAIYSLKGHSLSPREKSFLLFQNRPVIIYCSRCHKNEGSVSLTV